MKLTLSLAMILIMSPLLFAQKATTFTGEIMDKQCAQMGSHQNMMEAEHVKTAKDCTLACVKSGDSFALLDPSTKKVYAIEDEKKARPFAGQHVQITGNYDQDSQILHIETISAAK